MTIEDNYIKDRKAKRDQIIEREVEPYAYRYERTHHAEQITKEYQDKLEPGDYAATQVSLAGRIMQTREMGKATFYHIMDESGRIQVYFKQDEIGKDAYKLLKKFDIGDFIGIAGDVFKTKRGEVTVYVKEYEFLTKSLRTLPEKYHGLKDTEIRYRKRYLDLIMNPSVRVTFQLRSKIIRLIREYLQEKGFMEVDVPALQTMYGGANARPFKTHINAWDMDMYLSISPELYLKRLVVGGFEKVFTICKNFRNEGVDRTHNPEFTMLEYYQAYADYNDMIKLTEKMIESVAKTVLGDTKVHYQGQVIDFKTPWKRLTMEQAVNEYADIDVSKYSDEELFDLRLTYNIEYEGDIRDLTRGLMIQLLFEELCEDKIMQPVHIIDHPKESTPLCKAKRGDKELIERFESYAMGAEITNGYSELNDPELQRQLLQQQAEQLRRGMEESHPMDEDFVQAIEYGMPPTGGVGIGLDRIVMLLTDEPSLRDVILFPTMKPVKED